MKNKAARITRSAIVSYSLVAFLFFALASPLQALAESGVEGGLVALEQRVAAAEAAISNLQGAVTAAIAAANAYTDTKVAEEKAARQAADATLQTNIDAEAAARQAADTTLQGNINAEASARATGDASTLAAAKAYTDAKGVSGYEVVFGPYASVAALADGSAIANCPAGKKAVGGGGWIGAVALTIRVSRPIFDGSGWDFTVHNDLPLDRSLVFRAEVVCVKG